MLPDDRDDIEMEMILKLKAVADKRDQVTIGFLYAVARNTVRTYWRKNTGSELSDVSGKTEQPALVNL